MASKQKYTFNPLTGEMDAVIEPAWGSISGDINLQQDLQSALSGKEDTLSKGDLIQGSGISLTGDISNRLVGSGHVTVDADIASLNDIGDVAVTSPANDEGLYYDSALGKWVNKAPSGGGGQKIYDYIVDTNGGGDYTNLFSAIDVVNSGTIGVMGGSYIYTGSRNLSKPNVHIEAMGNQYVLVAVRPLTGVDATMNLTLGSARGIVFRAQQQGNSIGKLNLTIKRTEDCGLDPYAFINQYVSLSGGVHTNLTVGSGDVRIKDGALVYGLRGDIPSAGIQLYTSTVIGGVLTSSASGKLYLYNGSVIQGIVTARTNEITVFAYRRGAGNRPNLISDSDIYGNLNLSTTSTVDGYVTVVKNSIITSTGTPITTSGVNDVYLVNNIIDAPNPPSDAGGLLQETNNVYI